MRDCSTATPTETWYFYVTNLQGDVVLLDANGNTAASYSCDAWGKVLSATGTMAELNPIRYRGYYYDKETGFYYRQSRYKGLVKEHYNTSRDRSRRGDNQVEMQAGVQLIGLYPFDKDKNLYLIEIMIHDSPTNVDLSLFLQKDESLPKSNWQTAYDEQYLNREGTEIIGDAISCRELSDDYTRVVFFMYLERLDMPLTTPYGEIPLCNLKCTPLRLKKIITYTPID